MSQKKCKLVLKTNPVNGGYKLAKSVNTNKFGKPGTHITDEQADRILKDNNTLIERGSLTVEFVE